MTAARYTAESYTYQWSTVPEYYYVYDGKERASVGRRYPTLVAAETEAKRRNEVAR